MNDMYKIISGIVNEVSTGTLLFTGGVAIPAAAYSTTAIPSYMAAYKRKRAEKLQQKKETPQNKRIRRSTIKIKESTEDNTVPDSQLDDKELERKYGKKAVYYIKKGASFMKIPREYRLPLAAAGAATGYITGKIVHKKKLNSTTS